MGVLITVLMKTPIYMGSLIMKDIEKKDLLSSLFVLSVSPFLSSFFITQCCFFLSSFLFSCSVLDIVSPRIPLIEILMITNQGY